MSIYLDKISPEDIVECCGDDHIINVIKHNIKLLKLAHKLATIVDKLEPISIWQNSTTIRIDTKDHQEMKDLVKELLNEVKVDDNV